MPNCNSYDSFYFFVCLCMYMDAFRGQKRVLNPLELEFPMWVLRMKLWSSGEKKREENFYLGILNIQKARKVITSYRYLRFSLLSIDNFCGDDFSCWLDCGTYSFGLCYNHLGDGSCSSYDSWLCSSWHCLKSLFSLNWSQSLFRFICILLTQTNKQLSFCWKRKERLTGWEKDCRLCNKVHKSD